ncbi:MAG TPA: exodeoxyribonuclease VII large subunit [Verrucomicrobiae bacterium]|nr:exodeoxyribonuclease VII large subunit [Verrucomicrobiae bacterium]
MIPAPLPGQPLSVAQAITLFNTVLGDLTLVVEGEVASYGVSQGKFVFFDIKDEEHDARLGCFMMLFKQNVPLEDGMRVSLTCRPNIHLKSGKFSLTVERIEPKGEGSIKRAYELLKQKLEAEGLFAESRKRPLPRFPRKIGIISSAGAAGYGDFMRIAGERLCCVDFVFANVAVQGIEAEDDIAFAFDHLNSHYDLDTIVLVRGGGSIEDLHAFNSERVARAIVRSKAPVIVGVGHEKDITIADYCADVRAATPSNAAQLLIPTTEDVVELVVRLTQSGRRLVERAITYANERVVGVVERMHQQLLFRIQSRTQYIEQLTRTITALSPQTTLERGYSITCIEGGGTVRKAADVQKGDTLITRFLKDSITSQVQ